MSVEVRWRVVIGVCLLTAVAVVETQEAPATGTGAISGRVLVAGTPAPVLIRRARVTLDGSGGRRVTDSDTDGRYSFQGLPPGTYVVAAEKPGFVALAAGAVRPSIRPSPVTLSAGEALSLDVLLPRGAAFEGRVVDDRGEPVPSVSVGAFRLSTTRQGRRPSLAAQATTDDRGHYRIHSLAAGAYFIEAWAAVPSPARPGGAGEVSTGLARTWFPGASRVTDAQSVRAERGETKAGIDIELLRVPMARLTLRVVDPAGAAPRVAACRMQPVGGPSGTVSGYSLPAALNVCEYPAVPPGDYWLMGAARQAPGAPALFGVSRVSVSGDDLGEIALRMAPADPINGVVEADPAEAWSVPPGLRVVAVPALYDMPSPDRGPGPYAEAPAVVSSDGSVRLRETFGPTVFRLSGLPRDWALAGAYVDDRDVTDQATDLTPLGRPRTLRLVVTRRTARLSGTVRIDGRRVPPGTRVVVFAEDPSTWGAFSRHVIAAMPDADGRFACEALLPATYLVAVSDELDEDDWNDPAVLSRLANGATTRVLAAGDRAEMALVLRQTR